MAKHQAGAMPWLLCALFALGIGQARAQTRETTLYTFASPPNGAYPYSGVMRDSAGNIYGTTTSGGKAGVGIIYKLDTSGSLTVLHSFGGLDGSDPVAGVVGDSAGNFYGTTYFGGATNAGVVYQLDASGHLHVLYSFTGGDDGSNPQSGVIRDKAGNLYGTTYYGGAAGAGAVYKLDTSGHQTVLYSFTGGADGGNPVGGVISDSAGNLFGTTYYGGSANMGVVYKLDATGQEIVLHTFTGSADGANPSAGVIRDSSGNLYGTTVNGGKYKSGVVYKVDASGVETVLHTFAATTMGTHPNAGVIRDSAGNLYGTTATAIDLAAGTILGGVVYKLDTTGKETVLYSLSSAAETIYSGVFRDSAGDLYGTVSFGTAGGLGEVFMLNPAGQATVLYSFSGVSDARIPHAPVITDSAGNLYGTTVYYNTGTDTGAVFKLDAAGQETLLHIFTGGADGGDPGCVIRGADGNLYGAAFSGGASGLGVVYKLDTAGQQTVLHSFTGPDGAGPIGVIRDSAGALYGTTYNGGTSNIGVVFKLDTAGTLTVLHNFANTDGRHPNAGVIRDSQGNLYGTTSYGGAANSGVVFKLDKAGNYTILYSFTGGADGFLPNAGVILDAGGNLYGTTTLGGAANMGVVFKLDTTGHETVLYSFTGGADGGQPYAGVIIDSAGNLYGTTNQGGKWGGGVVYKVDTASHETVLHAFTGGVDGAFPWAGVTRDSEGTFYGTAAGGGAGSGVVFELTPN